MQIETCDILNADHCETIVIMQTYEHHQDRGNQVGNRVHLQEHSYYTYYIWGTM